MMSIVGALLLVSPVFAQIDPGDPEYEVEGGVSVVGAIEALYDIGVWPILVLAGVIAIAAVVYSRFRK